MEKAQVEAEPSQLAALLSFASRAYRRPLGKEDRDDLLAAYREAREKDGLDQEGAIRDCVVTVLMSPDFCYRIDLMAGERGIHPLSDYDLASRLSYFLWSSLPDTELLPARGGGRVAQSQSHRGGGAADAEGSSRSRAGGGVRGELAGFPAF